MSLPEKGWKGYGRPDQKLTLRLAPDAATLREAMAHEVHAEVAEYRLRTDGILPELVAYVQGLGAQPWTK